MANTEMDGPTRGFKAMRTNRELAGLKHVGIVIVPTNSYVPQETVQTTECLSTSKIVIQPYNPTSTAAEQFYGSSVLPSRVIKIEPKLLMVKGQMDFYRIICTEDSCIKYFSSVGMLEGGKVNAYCKNQINGHTCGAVLKEHTQTNSKKYEFIKDLKCSNEDCDAILPANKLLSYTDPYNPSRLSLCHIMELIWMWCHLYTKPMANQLSRQSKCTVREWFKYCQEICDFKFEQREPMGGSQGAVHVDEYLCSDKISNYAEFLEEPCIESVDESKNYGNRLFGPWVFALCWKQGAQILETRYFIVDRRDAETLHPIIKKEVKVGTTIHCDSWLVYEALSDYGYFLSVHEQSIFQDSETGRRTRAIERLAEYVKRKKYDVNCEGTRNSLNLLLREEWWRSRNPSHNAFNAFLLSLKQVYCKTVASATQGQPV